MALHLLTLFLVFPHPRALPTQRGRQVSKPIGPSSVSLAYSSSICSVNSFVSLFCILFPIDEQVSRPNYCNALFFFFFALSPNHHVHPMSSLSWRTRQSRDSWDTSICTRAYWPAIVFTLCLPLVTLTETQKCCWEVCENILGKEIWQSPQRQPHLSGTAPVDCFRKEGSGTSVSYCHREGKEPPTQDIMLTNSEVLQISPNSAPGFPLKLNTPEVPWTMVLQAFLLGTATSFSKHMSQFSEMLFTEVVLY